MGHICRVYGVYISSIDSIHAACMSHPYRIYTSCMSFVCRIYIAHISHIPHLYCTYMYMYIHRQRDDNPSISCPCRIAVAYKSHVYRIHIECNTFGPFVKHYIYTHVIVPLNYTIHIHIHVLSNAERLFEPKHVGSGTCSDLNS